MYFGPGCHALHKGEFRGGWGTDIFPKIICYGLYFLQQSIQFPDIIAPEAKKKRKEKEQAMKILCLWISRVWVVLLKLTPPPS